MSEETVQPPEGNRPEDEEDPRPPAYETLPADAADDVTLGTWLDVNQSAAAESGEALAAENYQLPPAGTATDPGFWSRIKRALGLKS